MVILFVVVQLDYLLMTNNLFLYGKSIEDLQSDASRNIILLHNWFIANKLSLNIEKTCYSSFGATETEKSKFQLNIGDIVLHQVECFKYLGVFIDSELTWQQHIENIYSKIVKFTSIFYKIRHKLNFQVLTEDVVFCTCTFTFIIWHWNNGNTYQKHLHKLIILNNKILHVLQNVPYDTPVVKLYADFLQCHCLICTVFKFYSLFINLFIIHINYLLFSQPISPKIICFIITVLGHKTVFILNIFRSSLGQRCIKYKGSILWNTLPDDLKCISSIGSFKKNLQELFIADYMYNIWLCWAIKAFPWSKSLCLHYCSRCDYCC